MNTSLVPAHVCHYSLAFYLVTDSVAAPCADEFRPASHIRRWGGVLVAQGELNAVDDLTFYASKLPVVLQNQSVPPFKVMLTCRSRPLSII